MADQTCGKGCCVWNPLMCHWDNPLMRIWVKPKRQTYNAVAFYFCPQTGERLSVVDGQPVVEAQVPAADLAEARATVKQWERAMRRYVRSRLPMGTHENEVNFTMKLYDAPVGWAAEREKK